MRAVVTRVSSASVRSGGETLGEIRRGLLVLLGVGPGDTPETADRMADKVCGLRIFADPAGKMNLDLAAAEGSLLVVSQFTLYADCRSRRPGFSHAAGPEMAAPLYERFMEACRERGFSVACGRFGADMQVASLNDGPVTILLEI